MNPKLGKIVSKIKDKKLREKVAQFVEEPTVEIDGKVYRGLPLERSPASISNHHNYPGGWLEHVVATAEIALTLCDVVEKVYGGKVDRDLVLSGVVLHDIFKPLTYAERAGNVYEAAPLAERLDHLTLAVSELIRRGFPMALIHIVCAHHAEFGPTSPKTLEALIVNTADVADSRLNGKVLRAAEFLIRQATGEYVRQLSSRDAFAVVRIKAEKGLEAVKEYVAETRGT